MEAGQPSRTAFAAAMYRAVHQIADRPVLFADPLAVKILGLPESALLEHYVAKRTSMRAYIVARSLLAEATLAAAAERGCRQYVVLGAGFDTFAYRNPLPEVRVFEVDHPATQAWKRERLAAIGASTDGAIYTPIDFERETLADALARAGFDTTSPAVFAWLGVVPYLTREAVIGTLAFISGLAAGSEVVFDYVEPVENAPPHIAAVIVEQRQTLAAAGEPILTTFEPADLAGELARLGFSEIEDLEGEAVNARFFKTSALAMIAGSTAHVLRARV